MAIYAITIGAVHCVLSELRSEARSIRSILEQHRVADQPAAIDDRLERIPFDISAIQAELEPDDDGSTCPTDRVREQLHAGDGSPVGPSHARVFIIEKRPTPPRESGRPRQTF